VKSSEKLKPAPKIFKEDCKINWKRSAEEVHNFIRGLSPYPTAWTELKGPSPALPEGKGEMMSLKIFKSNKETAEHEYEAGSIQTDEKTFVKIAVKDGFIRLLEIQLAGKKRMGIEEFLRGFSFKNWKINT
jgi:methionyl-tRNA formyltransferase